MTTHYVEDYEQLTGQKIPKSEVEAKVIAAPEVEAPKHARQTAEVK